MTVYLCSCLLLFAYDIAWIAVRHSCEYLIHVVWVESVVWFIARLITYDLRAIISLWAVAKRQKSKIEVD